MKEDTVFPAEMGTQSVPRWKNGLCSPAEMGTQSVPRWRTPSYYKLCLNYLICIKLIIHKKYLIRLNYLKFTVTEIKHFIQFKHYIGLNLTWR